MCIRKGILAIGFTKTRSCVDNFSGKFKPIWDKKGLWFVSLQNVVCVLPTLHD